MGIIAAYLEEKYGKQYFDYIVLAWILVYIPLVTIVRMKTLDFTTKMILKSMIPFWGIPLRSKVWGEK